MRRTTFKLAAPYLKFHATAAEGCLTIDIRFNAHQASIYSGSKMVLELAPEAVALALAQKGGKHLSRQQSLWKENETQKYVMDFPITSFQKT
ncbi:hypothetical protein AVEN_32767-1 [Araneus ventricosus]|uniref:Uncharacterized protein n=1 Tax=Araneus ventricosus TaxID=182803 RepID=A0A4Y2CUR0_ARAVE|nr:hypothetical protein AVEN_32767-1 [Araneus ventricosus]